jgi:hypothetical protein
MEEVRRDAERQLIMRPFIRRLTEKVMESHRAERSEWYTHRQRKRKGYVQGTHAERVKGRE